MAKEIRDEGQDASHHQIRRLGCRHRPAGHSADYNVTLVVLDVDPETGEGEGHAIGGAELSVDKDGQLQIEFPGTQPTRLTRVKRQKIEKKDG